MTCGVPLKYSVFKKISPYHIQKKNKFLLYGQSKQKNTMFTKKKKTKEYNINVV